MSCRFDWGPRKTLLALTSLVAACTQAEPDQPLSPLAARDVLVGRQILATENGAGSYQYLYLRPNGVALVNGQTAEFGRWRITEAGELCLQWHDGPERCSPVYQTGGFHYRSGATDLSVLGSCYSNSLGYARRPFGSPFAAGPFNDYPGFAQQGTCP